MKNYVVKWNGEYLLTTEKRSETIHYGEKQKEAFRFTKEEAESQVEIEKTFYRAHINYKKIRAVRLKLIDVQEATEALKDIAKSLEKETIKGLREEIEQLKAADGRAQHFKAQAQNWEKFCKQAQKERVDFIRGYCDAARAGVERLREEARKQEASANQPKGCASAAEGAGVGSQSGCPAGRDNSRGETVCIFCGGIKIEGAAPKI